MAYLVKLELRGDNKSNLSIDRFDESFTILLKLKKPLSAHLGFVVSSHEITRPMSRQRLFLFGDKTMKKCFKCELEQPLDNFYKQNKNSEWRSNKCKQCTKDDAKLNRIKQIDYYREYDRERANLPKRIKARKEYQTNKPEAVVKGKKQWAKRNPFKRQAHFAVSNVIRDGKLVKQPCEKCGNTIAQAHHDDYTKPLDVRWLCVFHHNEYHKLERQRQREQSVKAF